MKLNLPFVSLLLLLSGVGYGQSRMSIKGTVKDSSQTTLPMATVMFLTPQDSALVSYGRTNDNGLFEFKQMKRAAYLLKISYVGYLPYQRYVEAPAEGDVQLDDITLEGLNKDLFEVVIKTAKAPLSIRGDTVEYNAASFKVPPGATVEDLLRRLPGMQVEQDGTIRAQGQEVKRVTVDGKRFFGDDPKMATKNLPAEAITKVQVFNDKSEQSRLTGIDDGKQEKTVNLELKEEFKKGGFGKATAGVGTDGRVEGKVNYNRFDEKRQLAVVGFGNNTNQSGLSWDDYQDFRGSQAFQWSDDGDFGFGSGGGMRFITFNDDEESLTIQAGRSSRDRGFTKNYAGGVNYNYETKKTKFSSSYFYNQTEQTLDARSSRQNFLVNETFRTDDDNSRLRLNGNHRGTLRFEQSLDSNNTLVAISNFRFGNGTNTFSSVQQFFREGPRPANQSQLNNYSIFNSFSIANTLIYRHKFKKKGRNFAASLGLNLNSSEGDNDQQSVNTFGRADRDSVVTINQFNDNQSIRNQFKGSALFIEPINKKFYWETFYNFSRRSEEAERNMFDRKPDFDQRNDQLSAYYTNAITYQRLGTSIRYSHKGLNISTGLAGIYYQLLGDFASSRQATDFTKVNRTFSVVVPNVSMNFDLKNNKYLYAGYNMNVNEPSIADLQPIIDNSNPLFIRQGNPDLLPATSHNFNAGFNYFNPGNFMQMYAGINYGRQVTQIVYNQTVDENLLTYTMPMNIEGGSNVGFYGNVGFPIVKTKATMNINTNLYTSQNPIFINGIQNDTRTNSLNMGLSLNLTPSDKFTFYPTANWNFSNTSYSINSAQNQQIVNTTYGAEMNVKLLDRTFFNSRFSYLSFLNERFGFDQRQAILNASVSRVVLKNQKGEIRLSAYDLFNQNKGIRQFASQNFVSQEQVQTLARYFMLSFTYNMRGVNTSVRRKGFF